MPTATDYLSTYLRDHRAGAGAGSDLAARLRDQNAGTPYEAFLTRLAREVEEDIATLESFMERFDVGRDLLKTAGAKVGETLGRLKPNEHLADYSPLSRVQEIEMLRAGVHGKLAMWDALYEVSDTDDRLDRDELLRLVDRAENQLTGLREHHRMAVREAFGG